jgi:glycosidase
MLAGAAPSAEEACALATPSASPRRSPAALVRYRGASGALAAAAIAAALAGCGGSTYQPREVDTSPVAVADPGSALPADWRRGVMMEIFVRAYQDSDGDGIGDLRGLIDRLDYLQALGVTGLWLMPITASQDGDHGYAVTDYRAVEPAYGDLEDLDALLAAAHARGIGVILDYVMNHSAARHPAFGAAMNDAASPFRAWYVWSDDKPGGWSIYGNDPWHPSVGRARGFYFGGFWDQMPDWNLQNPDVVRWHHDNLRFWLNRGVDGFRFDAVGNLVEHGPGAWENQPENYALLGETRQVIEQYAQRFLVCEGPADPVGYAAPSVCGAAFAFGRQGDFVGAARGQEPLVAAVARSLRSSPPGLVSFVSNHDSFAGQRLFDQVGGDLAQYRLAAASYLLQPGPAFLYYGEEIGMAGAAGEGGDPKLRTPMSWTGGAGAGFTSGRPFRALSANAASFNVAAQENDPGSLLSFYRALLGLRRQVPALSYGENEDVFQSGLVLTFRRRLGAAQAVVAFNYGTSAAQATVRGLPPGAALARGYPVGAAGATSDASGELALQLPPQSVQIFLLTP